MSQRIKWFSAKTYKDRGCPIQVFMIQDNSRMYRILKRKSLSVELFGYIWDFVWNIVGEAAHFSEEFITEEKAK